MAAGPIEPGCAEGLMALERRGYAVWRVPGYAAIDQGRSQVATDALAQGFDELLWIDSDIRFDPDSVEMLREHELPLVSGIYAKKGVRQLACYLKPETRTIEFGETGGLLEIHYAATGFLLTRREVYETMAVHEKLPTCNLRFGKATVPYFLPMLLPQDGEDHWYLGEDYSFCERARRSGFGIWADTRIRLEHIGSHGYTWEDAGSARDRFANYTFHIG